MAGGASSAVVGAVGAIGGGVDQVIQLKKNDFTKARTAMTVVIQ